MSMADRVYRVRVEDVVFRVAGLAVAALLGLACQTTRDSALSPGPTTPASKGTVSASADPNGNTEISVVVDHLPPPERLSPELSTFVVWIRPAGSSRYLNAGQLTIGDDRSGELETITPHADVEVLVTAEASGSPGYPSTYKILEGRAQR